MKQNKIFLWKNKIFYALIASIFIFSACKKDTPSNNTPVSGLMAVNLIPDQPAVDFIMSNNYLTNSPLVYTNYTGTYLSIFSGNRTIDLAIANADTTVSESDYNFEQSKFYSVFAVGANGNYHNLIVNDNVDSTEAASGGSFVRYVNAIPDSSKADLSITQSGNDIVKNDAPFATASEFKTVEPGDITVTASGENYSVNRTITVEKNKAYTIMLMGLPEASDTAKSVKIKYIINGTTSQNP